MKTERWIEVLARNAGPAPRNVVARRLLPVMVLGLMASSVLAVGLIGPLPAAQFLTPAPWIKLAYAGALALAGSLWTARLARPVACDQGPVRLLLAVLLVMALGGLLALAATPAGGRAAAVWGQTWWLCPWMLMGFSLPALAGVLWALRGLAPTQARRAGWASGLLAGALGAAGYALACPEAATPFVAIWYTLGVALSATLGAALGPYVLRW